MNTVTEHEFQVVLNHVYGDAVSASRIIAGALWLDQVDGDWWAEDRFNLDTFDINNPSRCVLGQVVLGDCGAAARPGMDEYSTRAAFYRATYTDMGDYLENKPYLGDALKYALPDAVAKTLGFHLLDNEHDNWSTQMNRGWYALIAHRQGREDTVYPPSQQEID